VVWIDFYSAWLLLTWEHLYFASAELGSRGKEKETRKQGNKEIRK